MDTSIYKSNPLKRHSVSVLLVAHYLWSRLFLYLEGLSTIFFHLVVYKRQTGYIQLGVEDSESDGRIRFRVHGENGQLHFSEINFRLFNRWLARDSRKCSKRLLWMIKTTVSTQDGLDGVDVHSVIWGMSPARRLELMPFDLSQLPNEEVIAKRLAKKKRFHDLLAKWFPTKPVRMGLTAEDAARNIILR